MELEHSSSSIDIETRKNRELKRVSQIIVAICQFTGVLAVVALVVLVSGFVLAKGVSQEEKTYGLTIIGVVFLGIFIVLLFAIRKDSTTLLFFTSLALFITGIIFGIATCLFLDIVTRNHQHNQQKLIS